MLEKGKDLYDGWVDAKSEDIKARGGFWDIGVSDQTKNELNTESGDWFNANKFDVLDAKSRAVTGFNLDSTTEGKQRWHIDAFTYSRDVNEICLKNENAIRCTKKWDLYVVRFTKMIENNYLL